MNPVQTFAQTLAWVRQYAPSEDKQTPFQRTMWFFAMREGDEMHDSLSRKDWGRLVLSGMKRLTRSEIETRLLEQEEAWGEGTFDLRYDLNKFFDVDDGSL